MVKNIFARIFVALIFLPPLVVAVTLADQQTDYRIQAIAVNLQQPFSIAFLPDGDMLVSEKPGRLRRIQAGKLLAEPVAGVPEVFAGGHGGLLDIALHPRFAQNHWLYFTFTTGTAEENALNVGRARYVIDRSGQAFLDDFTVIFSAGSVPSKAVHYGARLAFMADETLLLTIGERSVFREKAQSLDNLLGKTVRMSDDGSVPLDNPFVSRDGANPYIWSYGHRNPQGLSVDSLTGVVYLNEHGPQGGDELNQLQTGKNYGWPIATHGLDYSGGYITPFREYPGVEQPLVHWTPSLAPSGMTQCRGCQWPEWEGDLLIGMLRGRQVRRVSVDSGIAGKQQALLIGIGERIRDVRFGPDGALYVITDSEIGKVLKILPAPLRPAE